MKKLAIPAILIIVVAVICVIVLLRQKSLIPPSVMGEHFVPGLITDEAWRRSIAEDPTAHGYSGYGILQDRRSDVAIDEGLRALSSDDAYVWMNAASYLGSRGRTEAIPYLIKALRHSAWRSDEERVEILKNLTGQTFGNSCDAWYEWYIVQNDAIELDWESSLGDTPR